MNKVINIEKWRQENAQSFVPPVCNKLMHKDGQLDVMFVGGPNQRKDYHLQQSEEFFYQIKGDMVLKIIEKNRHKDVVIKEGEVFILPAATPHSPQRLADTMGIVLERQRLKHEMDLLCFYEEFDGELTQRMLYQTAGHWSQLSTNMHQQFQKFYESENYKTGKSNVEYNYPFGVNDGEVGNPVHLMQWIQENSHIIKNNLMASVFPTQSNAFKINVCGEGKWESLNQKADTWILQLNGSSLVTIQEEKYKMAINDSILIEQNKRYSIEQQNGSYALTCTQEIVPWRKRYS